MIEDVVQTVCKELCKEILSFTETDKFMIKCSDSILYKIPCTTKLDSVYSVLHCTSMAMHFNIFFFVGICKISELK